MTVLENPRFKSFFQVEIESPCRVVLSDGHGIRYVLDGETYVLLAPYLSRTGASLDRIVELLDGKLSECEIYYALMRLKGLGLIVEAGEALPKALSVLCNRLGVSEEEASRRLRAQDISVLDFGKSRVKEFEKRCRELELQVVPQGGLTAVFGSPCCRDELELLNRKALEAKTPWLFVKSTGAEIWVGPLFIPGKTGCFACFSAQVDRNLRGTEKRAMETKLSTAESMAQNLAANEIFKWVVQGENRNIEGKVISYNAITGEMRSHTVNQNPHCSLCGEDQPFRPFVLNSCRKRFIEDGGHRILSPEETVANYQHLVSPLTGVVSVLIPHFTSSAMTRSYLANQSALHLDSGALIHFGTLGRGKGKTDAQAEASALCEALEHHSGLFRGDEQRKRGSYRQLKGEAVYPPSCFLYSENQYRNREVFNQNQASFLKIPFRFNEEEEIDWSPSWSLTEKRFKLIPTAYCYYGYPFPSSTKPFFAADSNGCAAGNTKEEAILQGFFELVERDSGAIWWYSRLQMPRVDLGSFDDPYISSLTAYHKACGREVWVLDLTMDLKIPVFVAITRRVDQPEEEILMGFGAHFDMKIALSRALTEMNQSLECAVEAKSGMSQHDKFRLLLPWLKTAKIKDHLYLVPNSSLPETKYNKDEFAGFDDLKEDISYCQKRVEDKGMEMLVLDQTRPDLRISVARVIVPGLRHFWNRYAPGRLYDVPLELRLVRSKLKEENLNPMSVFL